MNILFKPVKIWRQETGLSGQPREGLSIVSKTRKADFGTLQIVKALPPDILLPNCGIIRKNYVR